MRPYATTTLAATAALLLVGCGSEAPDEDKPSAEPVESSDAPASPTPVETETEEAGSSSPSAEESAEAVEAPLSASAPDEALVLFDEPVQADVLLPDGSPVMVYGEFDTGLLADRLHPAEINEANPVDCANADHYWVAAGGEALCFGEDGGFGQTALMEVEYVCQAPNTTVKTHLGIPTSGPEDRIYNAYTPPHTSGDQIECLRFDDSPVHGSQIDPMMDGD